MSIDPDYFPEGGSVSGCLLAVIALVAVIACAWWMPAGWIAQ